MFETFTPEMLDQLDSVGFVKVLAGKAYVDWAVAFSFLTLATLTGNATKVAVGLITIDDAIRGLEARATQA